MKLSLTFLAATLLMSSVCNAENVVGCDDGDSVTFQDAPCAEGDRTISTSIPVATPAAKAFEATPQAGPVAGPSVGPIARPVAGQGVAPIRNASPGRYSIHSSRDELHLGMSDLQVLNNRRWGKPQKITRNRENRAWHEYWAYQTGANGGKQLHFVNGTLAGIEGLDRPTQVASMMVPAVMVTSDR